MFNVWMRNYLFFKKTILVSLFWTTLEPLMFLGALGYGFGHYISSIEGMSFLEFYYAGLLCTTCMMVSYFESTYPNYSKLTYQQTYSSMLLTPITTSDIFFGEILWGATKGVIGSFGVFVVASLFGLYNLNFFKVLPVLFLLSLVFSAFGMIMISVAKNYDSFIFSTSGIIVPLSLISGTYFSLNEISPVVKNFAYIFPLSHAVIFVRKALYGHIVRLDAVHVLVVLAYIIVLLLIGKKLFHKKLIS